MIRKSKPKPKYLVFGNLFNICLKKNDLPICGKKIFSF